MLDRVMMWEVSHIRRRELLEAAGVVEKRTGLRIKLRFDRPLLWGHGRQGKRQTRGSKTGAEVKGACQT